jgi:hypothetical protein
MKRTAAPLARYAGISQTAESDFHKSFCPIHYSFKEGLVKLTPVDEALEPVKVPSELVVIVTVTDAIV